MWSWHDFRISEDYKIIGICDVCSSYVVVTISIIKPRRIELGIERPIIYYNLWPNLVPRVLLVLTPAY